MPLHKLIIVMMRVGLFALTLCMLTAAFNAQLTIDCPSYVGSIFDESEIIKKFAQDIASGTVRSIHTR